MSLLRWRDSLELGIPAVDADHKRLFELLYQVRFLEFAGDDLQGIEQALSELLLYTQTHFRREERLMELGGYPDLERHRRIHEKFTDRVASLMARFRSDPSSFRMRRFAELLSNWLVDHVLGEDIRLKPYVAHLREAQAA